MAKPSNGAGKRAPPVASLAEVASALGVTERAVLKADPARVVLSGDGYDLAKTRAAWEANRGRVGGPGRGKKAEPEDDGEEPAPKSLTYWKTKRERESFLKCRLERQELQGKLVPIDVAESERADTSALIRTRLEGIAPKLADKLAACSSPRECRDMVAEEIRVVLDELADDGEREDSDE